jgi:hypothetical protein
MISRFRTPRRRDADAGEARDTREAFIGAETLLLRVRIFALTKREGLRRRTPVMTGVCAG